MEDSTEKRKKVDEEIDVRTSCPFCNFLLKALIAFLRLLGFNNGDEAYCPKFSSPEDCYSGGSDPPSTAVDPPDDDSEQESEYWRHVPPPPPWSGGGGGQTD